MIRSARRWAVAVLLAAMPAILAAQGNDVLARSLTAYRNLDYDASASGLRALLAVEGAGALAPADRQRARMYLGASEVFRSRRDAALEAFRAIVQDDARYRPDQLIFPPEVTSVFQQAKATVRSIALVVPPDTRILTSDDRFSVKLYAASTHPVRAVITDAFGGAVRVLHDGASGDSLVLLWNGRDGLGRLREAGRYELRVISRTPDGRDEREMSVPLTIDRIERDTLPWPAQLPASAFRQETAPASGGTRFLVTGLLGAGLVAAMPSVVGAEQGGSSIRFGLAAAFGVAGTVGKLRASSPRPITENVEYNRRQRDAWLREVARVRSENETRRAVNGLRVRAGAATSREIAG